MGQTPSSTAQHWTPWDSPKTPYTSLVHESDDDYSSAMAKKRESKLVAEEQDMIYKLWAAWKEGM